MSVIQFRENLKFYPGSEIQEHHVQIPQEKFGVISGSLVNLIPRIDEAILTLSEPYIAGTK